MRTPWILVLVLLITAPAVVAQTWNGQGSDDLLANKLNWEGGVAPSNNGTANLSFTGLTRPTPQAAVAWSIDTITFQNTRVPFSLGGERLTLYSSIGNLSSNDHSVANDLILGADVLLGALNGDLHLAGGITMGSFFLSVQGSQRSAISGSVQGGTLRLDGGDLELAGNNTCLMRLYGGTLRIASDQPWDFDQLRNDARSISRRPSAATGFTSSTTPSIPTGAR